MMNAGVVLDFKEQKPPHYFHRTAFLLPMLFYLGGGVFAFLQKGDDMQLLFAAIAGAVLAVISLILAITSRGGYDDEEEDYDDAFEDDYADEESDN